tara:strand:+ start:102 stop:890 length:789 start_codon:yes stop_codon:yes gene_type:complete
MASLDEPYKDKYTEYFPINDEHTIFITNLGIATRKQLNNFLVDYLENYFRLTNVHIPGDWRINLITKRSGESLGIAYVYFSNREMYHIFLGNNPDGTKNSARIPNPLYRKDMGKQENILKDIDLVTPAYIQVPYASVVENLCITIKDYKSGRNKYILPKIDPCILRAKKNIDYSKLICNRAPLDITKNDVKNIFSFFVKNPNDLNNGYPIIKIESKDNYSLLEVSFNPETNDGMFALIMTKKIKLNYKDKNYTLLFNHTNIP